MSSIRDLRDTLEQHAQGVHDSDLVGRSSAVRHRVGVVRRRRRSAIAGAAAALVAAVAVGVSLPDAPREPVPAERLLVGQQAPATLTSLGYTYEFAGGVEGNGRVSVALDDHTGPVLVTWATEGEEDQVWVRTYTGDRQVHRSPDFTGFIPMTPEERDEVTVSGEGRVAAAVYTLSEARPDGVTTDGVTLRAEIEDSTLLSGAVGEPGDTDLAVETVVPHHGRIALASSCRRVPAGYVVVEEIEGKAHSFGPCDDRSSLLDAAAGDWTPVSLRDYGLAPGDPVTVRMYVAEDPRPKSLTPQGSPVHGPAFDEVRLAAGLYEPSEPVRVDGATFDQVVEHEGHRWQFVAAQVGERGSGSFEAEVPVGGESPTLVVASTTEVGLGSVLHRRDGELQLRSTNGLGPGGGFSNSFVEYQPGHVYSMDAGRSVEPDTVLAFGFYQQLD